MALLKNDKKKNSRPSAKELAQLDIAELKTKLAEEKENLMRARFQHATAALENTSELKTMRRQIARMETILNQKQQRV